MNNTALNNKNNSEQFINQNYINIDITNNVEEIGEDVIYEGFKFIKKNRNNIYNKKKKK